MANALQIATTSPEEQRLVDGAIAMLSAQGMLTKFDENQQRAFIMTCMAIGVNPLLKEAYAVPYEVYDRDTKTKIRTLGIIIDFKVYLARAERSGLLDGWETKFDGKVVKKQITKTTGTYQKTVKVIDQDKSDLTGTITIWRKDWKKPFKSRPLSLVDEMKDTDFWHDDPVGMLEKALIREFFQKVFPKDCDLRDDTKESRVYASHAPEYEVVETSPVVDPKDKAQAYKDALVALDAVGLSSRVREQYQAKIKEAVTASDLAMLKQITTDLELIRGDAERKSIEARHVMVEPEQPLTPAEEAHLQKTIEMIDQLPQDFNTPLKDPEPVKETPPEDSAEQKAKTAVLTILRGLQTRGWHPEKTRNSLKKHLSLDVAEDEDWEALLWKAPFDRAVWIKAYKHWREETKKYDVPAESKALDNCRKAVKAVLDKLPASEHQEWKDQLTECKTDTQFAELEKLATDCLDVINNEKF